MAHFAKLDENNKVIRVSVVDNSNILDSSGNESEEVGIAYLKSVHGEDTNWKQTSYNNNIRGTFAAINYIYDEVKDVFYPQQPYASWTLDESIWSWQPPVPFPQDEKIYTWNEQTTSWVEKVE
jgi:hypothetical protein